MLRLKKLKVKAWLAYILIELSKILFQNFVR